jgi:prepilin-type N-terminal cleavage/methylation domain-containing protein/prepilin-type processing-associated H-X9-DG protein
MMPAVRRGFSMVELLVVIGIIAVLISLLVPALSKARESAKTIQCASQLRQIGQAIYAYASANGGLLPPYSGTHYFPDDAAGSADPNGPGWIASLQPNTASKPDSPLFHCPAFPVDDKSVNYFLEARWMDQQPSGPIHTMPITQIKLASQFILCGEASTPGWYVAPWGNNPDDAQDDIDKDDAAHPCLLFFGEEAGYNLHHAGNNILFADSHVQPFKKFDPQAMTYNPTKLQDWPDVNGQ